MSERPTPLPTIRSGQSVILVVARLPEHGKVKTRLASCIGADAALNLHAAFLRDTLGLAARVARQIDALPVLAYTGDRLPSEELTGGLPLLEQESGDLGRRQVAAHGRLFAAGAAAIVTIGSDSPTLPESRFTAALDRLADHDAVVDPAGDGGYTLLGVSRAVPGLLARVPWGTNGVQAALTRNALAEALRLAWLPGWYDVDNRKGLDRLERDLNAWGDIVAPESAAALASWRERSES
jgi:rSAM/selenodomain-associated transferase 1